MCAYGKRENQLRSDTSPAPNKSEKLEQLKAKTIELDRNWLVHESCTTRAWTTPRNAPWARTAPQTTQEVKECSMDAVIVNQTRALFGKPVLETETLALFVRQNVLVSMGFSHPIFGMPDQFSGVEPTTLT